MVIGSYSFYIKEKLFYYYIKENAKWNDNNSNSVNDTFIHFYSHNKGSKCTVRFSIDAAENWTLKLTDIQWSWIEQKWPQKDEVAAVLLT